MRPKIIFLQKLLPSVNYYFVEEQGKIRILSDAIKTPEIFIEDQSVKVKGEWVYKRDQLAIIRKDEGKEEIAFSNPEAIDFVYINNEIYSVEQKGKSILFNGEKYSSFIHKYSFSVLENKDKIKVFVDGKELELDKPLNYRINPPYLNLVYENQSMVVDFHGNKTTLSKPGFYLGKSSKGEIYQTLTGKIVVGKEEELLGLCSSESYFLGEASLGIVLVCENKVKYYYRGAWGYLSGLSSLTSSYANFNFVVVTDFDTIVYDGEFHKLFNLKNVHSVFADRKYVYVISQPRKLYIIEPLENYMPFDMKYEGYGITITMDKPLYETFSIGQGLIKVSEAEEGDKVTVRVEASHLSVGAQSKVEISNELTSYPVEVKIPPAKVDINLKESMFLVSDGRVKNMSSFYNAILLGKVKYKINSKLGSTIKVKVLNKEFSYNVSSEGELTLEIPVVKYDANEETVSLSIIRNGYIELTKEYVAKAKEVKNPKKYKTYEEIYNASRRKITKSENNYFEWVTMEEYPEPYNNTVIAKADEIINIDGKSIEVKSGVQKVVIQRENYLREYTVYGIENPVKGIEAYIEGNKLNLKLDLSYKIPITVIYGTQIETNTKGVFQFSLDPFYTTITIKALYSDKITWENGYSLSELMKSAYKKAIENSEKLKEYLSNLGIV